VVFCYLGLVMPKFDINEPILVLVRRGRKGRGFSVSPVEDVSNSSACMDAQELGEVIVELLDDPDQPRVDLGEILSAAANPATETQERDAPRSERKRDIEEAVDDDADEEEDDDRQAPASSSGDDLLDKLALQGLSFFLAKGREMSSPKVKPRRKKK
jgi:hypothetical protein